MKHVMIWLVSLYRKIISPIKPPCCRFTPTCSAYAIEAFRKRGFFVGLILTVWRILRCNPFSKGGYDPVPEKGFRNPKNIAGNDVGEKNTTTNDIEKETENDKD
jgi:putative membrane protein insertion efficiency factor